VRAQSSSKVVGTDYRRLFRVLTTPIELVKIRQQSFLGQTTALQVTYQIVHEGGLLGLYRGFTATLLRESNYGPYFACVCDTAQPVALSANTYIGHSMKQHVVILVHQLV